MFQSSSENARRRIRPSYFTLMLGVGAALAIFGACTDEQNLTSLEGLDGTTDTETASEEEPQAPAFVPGRLLVKFREVAREHVDRGLTLANARISGEIRGIDVKIVELPPEDSETAHLAAFRQRPEVEFAELDVLVPPALLPNDTYFPNAWHLPQIGATAAWDTTVGSENVIIAILDSGVNSAHPDLAAKIVPGWNIYDNNSDTTDINGHGTAVAGQAAALSNNGQGVASPAWGCKIMPIRIAGPSGWATASNAAAGVTWAAEHGARAANISFSMSTSPSIATAASYMQSLGGIVTISSGNEGNFVSNPDNPNVVVVGATDQNDAVPAWSTTGNNVDLTAPGVNIYTTTLSGGYGVGTGTSASAPIVAAIGALVMSVNPDLSGQEVQDILKQSADDLGPAGWDPSYGWGRINAAAAVQLASAGDPGDSQPPSVSFTAPADGATLSGTVEVQVSASDNAGVTQVGLYVDGALYGTDSAAPYSFSVDTQLFANGGHTLLAEAADAAGNAAQASISVVISNSSDTTPPTISITSPASGATVKGKVSVKVTVGDNVGVTMVQLYVDGVLKDTKTAPPFTTKWNTAQASAGAHTLECRAFDAAGNDTWSSPVTVYK